MPADRTAYANSPEDENFSAELNRMADRIDEQLMHLNSIIVDTKSRLGIIEKDLNRFSSNVALNNNIESIIDQFTKFYSKMEDYSATLTEGIRSHAKENDTSVEDLSAQLEDVSSQLESVSGLIDNL